MNNFNLWKILLIFVSIFLVCIKCQEVNVDCVEGPCDAEVTESQTEVLIATNTENIILNENEPNEAVITEETVEVAIDITEEAIQEEPEQEITEAHGNQEDINPEDIHTPTVSENDGDVITEKQEIVTDEEIVSEQKEANVAVSEENEVVSDQQETVSDEPASENNEITTDVAQEEVSENEVALEQEQSVSNASENNVAEEEVVSEQQETVSDNPASENNDITTNVAEEEVSENEVVSEQQETVSDNPASENNEITTNAAQQEVSENQTEENTEVINPSVQETTSISQENTEEIDDQTETSSSETNESQTEQTPDNNKGQENVDENDSTTTQVPEESEETTETPKVPFSCERPGRFANEENCDLYYVCVLTPFGYIQLEQACMFGFAFDSLRQRCSPDRSQCDDAFQCTAPGRYADTEDTTKYYLCFRNIFGGFIQQHLSCQEGLTFNPLQRQCQLTSSHTDNDEMIGFVCSEEGTFADSNDCSKYITCTLKKKDKFKQKAKKCPKGEQFDSIFKVCSLDENVVCG